MDKKKKKDTDEIIPRGFYRKSAQGLEEIKTIVVRLRNNKNKK